MLSALAITGALTRAKHKQVCEAIGGYTEDDASDDALGGKNRVNQRLNAGITTDLLGMGDFIWKTSADYGSNALDLPPDHYI